MGRAAADVAADVAADGRADAVAAAVVGGADDDVVCAAAAVAHCQPVVNHMFNYITVIAKNMSFSTALIKEAPNQMYTVCTLFYRYTHIDNWHASMAL